MHTLLKTLHVLALCAAAAVAGAAELPFNQAQFDAARAAGQSVGVVFHADWCPTCRAQAPVLKDLANSPQFRSLTQFVADFDTEKPLRAALRVSQQSTIVVFRGAHETGRTTGLTDKPALEAFLHDATR
jgi:thiol-disulfide isomerase/thioredoxin